MTDPNDKLRASSRPSTSTSVPKCTEPLAERPKEPPVTSPVTPPVTPVDTPPVLENVPATADLLEAVGMRMPFGRFKGERLIDLPEPYVVWFRGQGFPAGALGQRMALVYELKVNGLEKLVRPMLDANPDQS